MTFHFESYVGVEKIKFGDTRKNIRNNLGLKFKEFIKVGQFGKNMDVYEFCHIHYGEDDLCEAIEFFGSSILILKGYEVKLEKYGDIKRFFESIDNNIDTIFDDCGFTSFQYGIGVYTPFPDELNSPIECIIIFKKGYYDETP
ncbi:MAG: hypothetical protein AAGU32_21525 [Bacillota bacterium]